LASKHYLLSGYFLKIGFSPKQKFCEAMIDNTRTKSDWRPLALTLVSLTALYAVVYRFIPFEARAYFLFPFGAWALYAGARLPLKWALPIVLGIYGITELLLYSLYHYPVGSILICLPLQIYLGRVLLSHSQNPLRIVGTSILSYAIFFLVTNFTSWLEVAMPDYEPRTFATLMLSYQRGLEFLSRQPLQLVSEIIVSLGLFGAHAYLAKLYFPEEQVASKPLFEEVR
jgi:hypothetical protein